MACSLKALHHAHYVAAAIISVLVSLAALQTLAVYALIDGGTLSKCTFLPHPSGGISQALTG